MPAASSARAGGYVLAGVTHLLAPAFLVTGVYLVSTLSVGGVLSGLIALDLAWLLRPRSRPSPARPYLSPGPKRLTCSPSSTVSARSWGRPGRT